MSFTNYLIAAIGSIAIGWYYICLFYLGFIHPQPDAAVSETFRQFMATSLETLSGTLATFVGMILGVQSASAERNANPLATVLQTRATPVTKLQAIAAIAYVLSLLTALFAWWYVPVANPTVVALGKSVLGLIGGVLAVVLNVNVRGTN
jgi:hypothetical protein